MRFCGNCGTALESQSAPAEERKLVTVLFADVVSSTRLAAVDPEQLRERMARFFSIAREEIRALWRHPGEVHRRRGDGRLRPARDPCYNRGDDVNYPTTKVGGLQGGHDTRCRPREY